MRRRSNLVTLSAFLASCLVLPGEPCLPSTTLAFVGDVMLGRGVAQALDGDWDAAFAAVRPWLAGPCRLPSGCATVVAFANLESPFLFPLRGGTEGGAVEGDSGPYDLRAPPQAVAALQAAGFDVVSLANNHALDGGEAGLRETVSTLRAAGITPLVEGGIGERVSWAPEHRPARSPRYQALAFDDSLAPLDLEAAAGAVAAAAQRADLVIVSVHWGAEYQAAPTPRQRAVATALAGAGAGLIVGHGPHVLQRVEWLGQTLVAYSLGNFLFDQPYPPDCRWGAILRVTLQGDRVVAVAAVPTVVERGRVRPAGPEDAAAILARLNLKPETLKPETIIAEVHR